MRTFTRGLLAAACSLAVLGLGAGAAQAQFLIDHYKVYRIMNPVPSGLEVDLIDQFGPSSHVIDLRDKLANPVLKTIPPEVPEPFPGDLLHPQEHLSWWKITPEPFGPQIIIVGNQFGSKKWTLGDAQYLLVPAIKDGTPGIELNQHYKCYDATGPDAAVTVELADQWGLAPHGVFAPRYFCNPVEKLGPPPLVPSGPPPAPEDHLACYDIDPMLGAPQAVVEDQVAPGMHDIFESELLCVPSRKNLPGPPIPVLSPRGLLAFGLLLIGAMYAAIRRRGVRVKA